LVTNWKNNMLAYGVRIAAMICFTLVFMKLASLRYEMRFIYKDWNVSGVIPLILLLVIGTALLVTANRIPLPENSKYRKVTIWWSEKLSLDAHFITLCIGSFLLLKVLNGMTSDYGITPYFFTRRWINDIFVYFIGMFIAGLGVWFVGVHVRGAVRYIRNMSSHRPIRNEIWVWKWYSLVKKILEQGEAADKKRIQRLILLCMVQCLMQLAVISLASIKSSMVTPFVFLTVLISVFLVYSMFQLIHVAQQLTQAAKEMGEGRFNVQFPEHVTGIMQSLVTQMNGMRQGLQNAMKEQVTSQRMKSELIANVSHDLKTPVTSLVSYIDLLKRDEGTEEEKAGYIQVLERKTQRLCLLVEDLFEAAKMASGDVELHLKQIDMGELLRQAVAEYSDSFEQAELQIRIREETEPVYAMVDGSRMWRVMENMLGNVLKYGLPQSRVYIELIEQGNQMEFTIKNVSAYEMEFSSDEIFERFKRGDRSRSTEGSGLGLSIARSIVELHKGSMGIQVDGDVFKVSVCLPRADRDMIQNTTQLAMTSSF